MKLLVDSLQIDGKSYPLQIGGFEVRPKTYIASKFFFGAGDKSSTHRYSHDWICLKPPDLQVVPEQTKGSPPQDKTNARGLAIAKWFNEKEGGLYPVLSGKWHEESKVDLALDEDSTFSFEFLSSLFWGHWAIRALTSVLLVTIVNAPPLSIIVTAYLTYREQCPGHAPTEIALGDIVICRANTPRYKDCQQICRTILTFMQGCHDRIHPSYAEIGLPWVLSMVLVYCFAMEAASAEHHQLLKKFIRGMSVNESEKRQVEDVDKAISSAGSFWQTAAHWKEYMWHGKMTKYKVCDLDWADVPYDQKPSASNTALTKVTEKQLSSVGDRFWGWEEVRNKNQLVALQLDNSEKPNPQGIEEEWAAWTQIKVTKKQWSVLAKEALDALKMSHHFDDPADVVEFSRHVSEKLAEKDDVTGAKVDNLASLLLPNSTLLKVEGKYGSVSFPQKQGTLRGRSDTIAKFRQNGWKWFDALEENGIPLCSCQQDWKVLLESVGETYSPPATMQVWMNHGDTEYYKSKSTADRKGLKMPKGALVFCYASTDKWLEVVKIETQEEGRKGLYDQPLFLCPKLSPQLIFVAELPTGEVDKRDGAWQAPDVVHVSVEDLLQELEKLASARDDSWVALAIRLNMMTPARIMELLHSSPPAGADPCYSLVRQLFLSLREDGQHFWDYFQSLKQEEEVGEAGDDDYGGLDMTEHYTLLLKLSSTEQTREHMLKATEQQDWISDSFPNWFVVAQMESVPAQREKRRRLNQMMSRWLAIPCLSLTFALVSPITRVIQDGSPMFPKPFTFQILFVCVFLFLMMNGFVLIYHRVTLRMSLMSGFMADFRQLTIDPSGTTKVAGLLESMVKQEFKQQVAPVLEDMEQRLIQNERAGLGDVIGKAEQASQLLVSNAESSVSQTLGQGNAVRSGMASVTNAIINAGEGALDNGINSVQSRVIGSSQAPATPSTPAAPATQPQGSEAVTEKPDDSTKNPFDLYVPETKAPYMPWLQEWRKAWAAKTHNLDKWQNCQTYLRVYLSQSRLVAQAMLIAAAMVLVFLLAISIVQAGFDPREAGAAVAAGLPNQTSALQLDMRKAQEAAIFESSEVAHAAAFHLSPRLLSSLVEAEEALVEVLQGALTMEGSSGKEASAPIDITAALLSLQGALRPHYQRLDEPLLQQVEVLSRPARRLAYSEPTELLAIQLPQNNPVLQDMARVTITQYVTVVTAIIILIYTLPLIFHIACINSSFDEHVALLTTVKSAHTDLQAQRDATGILLSTETVEAPLQLGSSTASAPSPLAPATGSTAPAGHAASGDGKETTSAPLINVDDPEISKFGRVVVETLVKDGSITTSKKFVVNSAADEGLQTYVRCLDSAIESCKVKSFPLVLFGIAISFTLFGTWIGLAASPILSQVQQIGPRLLVQGCLAVENTTFFQRLGTEGQKLFQDVVCQPIEDTLFPPVDNSTNGSNSTNSSAYFLREHTARVTEARRQLNAVTRATGKVTFRGSQQLPSEPMSDTLRSWWGSLQGRDKDEMALVRMALAQYKHEAMRRLVLVPNIISEAAHKSGWEFALELALFYLNEDPVHHLEPY